MTPEQRAAAIDLLLTAVRHVSAGRTEDAIDHCDWAADLMEEWQTRDHVADDQPGQRGERADNPPLG